jgi:hypothetical protein
VVARPQKTTFAETRESGARGKSADMVGSR